MMIVKYTKIAYNIFSRYLTWIYEAFILRKRIEPKIQNCPIIKNKRILILAPHSDDEWVGCSQLMGINKVYILCFCIHENNNELRKKELSDAARYTNTRHEYISNVDNLDQYISSINPEYIFIPDIMDWHSHHQYVNRCLYDIYKGDSGLAVNIGMYQVSTPIPVDRINTYNRLTPVSWVRKWVLFWMFYKTQRSIPFLRFSLLEIINGGISVSFAAEVYNVMSLSKWLEEYPEYLLTNTEAEMVKSKLQDIKGIFYYINSLSQQRAL